MNMRNDRYFHHHRNQLSLSTAASSSRLGTLLATRTDQSAPQAANTRVKYRAKMIRNLYKIFYTVVGTFATISRVIVMLYYNKVQNRAVPPSQVVGKQHRTRVRSCPVAVMCRSIVARVHPKCKSFQNASQGNPFGCCSRVEHPWPIPQGFNPYQNNCATSYRRPGA